MRVLRLLVRPSLIGLSAGWRTWTDAALDVASTAARRTPRLDQLRSILQVWRRVPLLNRENPEAACRLVDTTVEARQGVSRPDNASWDELPAKSGL
ncbi:hypothetical protein IOD16_14160 [Saccharothrix sp. 6-C]|uniref:DUF6247 family protein n=1 Tax=Saccharothrix sp. 6-C TaxID=2781735 RepID=UPI0019171A58|nr:DUF6247 family protein [Saccharothrix sp. 6-C]QQQ79442.1 hypothetical protein IOD16_14160 [Saccharothrix sp. 6-C]